MRCSARLARVSAEMPSSSARKVVISRFKTCTEASLFGFSGSAAPTVICADAVGAFSKAARNSMQA
jgi:hypothetical protein